MKLERFGQIFEKYSNIKFHEILPLRAELLHADGLADWQTDGRTGMTQLIIVLRKFSKEPKILENEFLKFRAFLLRKFWVKILLLVRSRHIPTLFMPDHKVFKPISPLGYLSTVEFSRPTVNYAKFPIPALWVFSYTMGNGIHLLFY
jgi:hypothetical protein